MKCFLLLLKVQGKYVLLLYFNNKSWFKRVTYLADILEQKRLQDTVRSSYTQMEIRHMRKLWGKNVVISDLRSNIGVLNKEEGYTHVVEAILGDVGRFISERKPG